MLHQQQQQHAAAAGPPATTFDPETKYRLLLRVHSAEELPHKSSQGAYCKLYVGATAMLDGSQKKLTKSSSTENNSGEEHSNNNNNSNNDHDAEPQHHSFRTQTKAAVVSATTQKSETTWDEIFEVSLRDPSTDVLSLRVKSQHRFYCPVIGTFAVYLRHLRVGHQADQWFPLRRGKKEAGRIRLHLLVTPEHVAPGGGKKRRGGSDLAPDIKVALAANFEADRAIQRLVNKQLKDEEERKARRARGEKSDEEEDQPPFPGSGRGAAAAAVRAASDTGAVAGLGQQLGVVSIAKVKEPATGLGSGRGDARFPVLLPPSPNAQNSSSNSSKYGNSYPVDAPVIAAAGSGRRNENFARLKQLEPISTVKEGRRQGDALGSDRGSSSARYALPGLVTTTTTTSTSSSHITKSSPTSPAGSGQQRSSFYAADNQTSSANAGNAAGERMSEADRNRRRRENFARLEELDAAPAPVGSSLVGSGRSGSSRSSLPNTPSDRNQSITSPVGGAGSARQMLYSIPSFGPADLDRSKRHSASSTDSDSLASAAEYERRIDRKLRKVRSQTAKLRKIKAQLRKYIPDLTDSDSDASSSSSSESGRTSQKRAAGRYHHQQQQQQQQHVERSSAPNGSSSRSSTSASSGRYYV